jgi:hypothetical protein
MNATNKIRRVEVRHTNEPSCLSQQALISVPGGRKLAEPICDQVFDRGHVQMATSGSDNFDLGRIRQTIELRSRYNLHAQARELWMVPAYQQVTVAIFWYNKERPEC